jgi:diadenosine tetraphosphate (Ap4A) HIT family hydrolase
MSESDCHICTTLATGPAESVILDDGAWQVFNVAGVPGWTMMAPHEHLEGIDGLTDAHAASLGPLARRVGRAVKEVTGAQRVHVVFLGDNALHFHIGFFPRQAGEDGLLSNGPMVAEMQARKDPEAAAPVTAAIREAIIASF